MTPWTLIRRRCGHGSNLKHQGTAGVSPLFVLVSIYQDSNRGTCLAVGSNWFLVGEFTTHFRLPILVVGLNRMFTGANRFGF